MSAANLTKEQISDLKEAFRKFDKEGKETIEVKNVVEVMESLGMATTYTEVKEMLSDVNMDGNDSIDFGDFVILMSSKLKDHELRDELSQAFMIFDQDKDGKISLEELSNVLSRLGENLTQDEISEMIREADLNGDGVVDFDEFFQLMTE